MAALFGHGRLRLYLITLLAEGERSGYDLIRELQERFPGIYSPSPGTVYPRLAKLEDEGLVARREAGRRTVYTLTEAGWWEMEDRRHEIVELEAELKEARAARAGELAATVTDLRREIEHGAAALREQFAVARRGLFGAPATDDEEAASALQEASGSVWAQLSDPLPEGERAAGHGEPPDGGLHAATIDQLREIIAIAKDAGERIRRVLGDTDAPARGTEPAGPGTGPAPPVERG